MSVIVMLIDATIAQCGLEKVYKGKVIDDAGNERKVIIKMSLRASGSMEKMRLKCEES
jgi:hypothetical protein